MMRGTKLQLNPDHKQSDKSLIEIAVSNSENDEKDSKPKRYNEESFSDKEIFNVLHVTHVL